MNLWQSMAIKLVASPTEIGDIYFVTPAISGTCQSLFGDVGELESLAVDGGSKGCLDPQAHTVLREGGGERGEETGYLDVHHL